MPTCGYKDVRSRILFPVYFNGRLRIGGELAIAPNDVDVSLKGVNSYVINSKRRCESQLSERALPCFEKRTPIKAGKKAKNPSEPASPLSSQDKHILTFFTLFS